LRLKGYHVIEAKDGLDALMAANKHVDAIDLPVTDVGMPNRSTGELAKEFAPLRRGTKFFFVSGSAGKTILDHKVVDLETNFLQKPTASSSFR
jgi:CheY-like chemotaxis protein